jgi:acetolactate synthase-1/3 small subunit
LAGGRVFGVHSIVAAVRITGPATMRHIISILLRNEAGALARVASLFSTRGYNIDSLNVAPTDDPQVSRLTLVTTGSDQIIAQINMQLLKLVDVVNLVDMTLGDHIERELLLLKVAVHPDGLDGLRELARSDGGRILDDSPATYTIELTGASARIDAFIERASAHADVVSVVRSGPLGISRGAQVLAPTS